MVKLIVYNIEYCEGMEGKWFQYLFFWRLFRAPPNLDEKIIKELKNLNPDILGLVEVDTGSIRAKKNDEVEKFSEELGMKDFVEAVKYPFKSWLKLFHFIPILRKQGNAIMSKNKLFDIKSHEFKEGTKRVIIEASINCPKKVTLLLAHLALSKKSREKQIKELITIVNSINNPVILMGDFNTFEGEAEISNLLSKTHLKHKFKLDKKSNTMTQPTFKPTKRLDYILTSDKIKVNNYEVLSFSYSDHLPLMVDFELD